ncbi:ABC transporter permease [Aerococcus kribbianus]|uniref:ABC transporter permease n=1 Tax=Aerococcus kribbianus TaxID=2999064 RepID=A0A9X3FU49_9LACT|nr:MULTISPECIES: ABC transporter permease [unclassified Aerococcus]MCZ0716906.1 ABC transporter permease [Aerococcus sp. YH-aer221]MCZ0725194.1 ABC transporter permease [Aerococcus sp. YH-aer222]
MDMIISAISQAMVWAVMGLGIFISFRILNRADLTAEGSFTLGAAMGVQMLHFGLHPLIALLLSFFAGMAGGAITGLLVSKLKINSLLAGIITMTGLYSVNLKIMGSANISLTGTQSLKDLLAPLNLPRNLDTIVIGSIICLIIIASLHYFLQTEMGQAMIATGDNYQMAKSMGIATKDMVILAYMLANGLIAVSGYLVATDNGFADISMGIGSTVIALAAIIIGEVLIPNVKLYKRLITIVLGSIVYRILLMLVLLLNFDANDFKLFSALIVALCLAIPSIQGLFQSVRAFRKGAK